MTKIAASETTKEDKVREAKRAFLLGLLDLSWKLAGAFLVPVMVGLVIDSSRGNSKSFTTAGIFIGLGLSFLVILQLARNSKE